MLSKITAHRYIKYFHHAYVHYKYLEIINYFVKRSWDGTLQGQPLPALEPPYQYRTYARIMGG